MNNNSNPKNIFFILLWIALVIASLWVTYYYVFALPDYNQQKLDLEEIKFKENEAKIKQDEEYKKEQEWLLSDCLRNSNNLYVSNRVWSCEQRKKDNPDLYRDDWNWSCILYTHLSEMYEKKLKEDKDECYKRYQN